MARKLNDPPLVYSPKLRYLNINSDTQLINRYTTHGHIVSNIRTRAFIRQRARTTLQPRLGSYIDIRASTSPRNLQPHRSLHAKLALGAAGKLKSVQRNESRSELWRADARTLLGTWHVIRRSPSCQHRRRTMDMLRSILRSRRGHWHLSYGPVRIKIPWIGPGDVIKTTRTATNDFFKTLHNEYSGALPLLYPRTFSARICWISASSIADIICTSQLWRKKQHWSTWPCTCLSLAVSWPRVRCPRTGMLHVCGGQEEIPWPSTVTWMCSWP